METFRLDTTLNYDVYVQCEHDRSLFQPSPPSFSSSPEKISFLLVRKTFIKYATYGGENSYERVVKDGSDHTIELSNSSFDVQSLETNSYEFYYSVFRSMEALGVEAEAIPQLVDLILDAAEKKLSESIPDQNFTELLVTVHANRTDWVSPFVDTSRDAEIAMRESMEEHEEANNGMIRMSERAKETMSKSIVFTGEEDSGMQSEGKDSSDGRSRDQVKTKGCVICLGGILVGSRATQVP